MCYLVIRRCCVYSYLDLIIGIFDTENKAIDVEINEIIVYNPNENNENNENIYFLIECFEGFGQIINKQLYFSTSYEDMHQKYEEIQEIKNKENESWVTWCAYDIVQLNNIRHKNNMRSLITRQELY